MAKPSEQSQIDFIVSLLRKGEQRKAILAKFGKNWQGVPERTFDRRLKSANDQLASEQKRIQAEAEQSAAKEAEARKIEIMTVLERKQLLSDIALGKIQVPADKYTYDSKSGEWVSQPVIELPDHKTRIAAIAELNKMEGDYAPSRTDVTTGGEKLNSQPDLSKLTTEDLRKLIEIQALINGGGSH